MKKYFYLLFIIGIIFLARTIYAMPCQSVDITEVAWGVGRIISFNTDIRNNTGCLNGYGTIKGKAIINDIPANITFWGTNSVGIEVPLNIDGLANIKVIDNNDEIYNINQLLISLKVDSYPQTITLGDSIEITGNFANTAGPGNNLNDQNSWPGRIVNLSANGFNYPLQLISWTENKIIFQPLNNKNYKIGLNTFKVYYGSSNQNNGYQSKTFDINISAPLCTINSWDCNGWSDCSIEGNQIRTCNKNIPCEGGESSPETSQNCTPLCTSDTWSCGDWDTCSIYGLQIRTCNKTLDCSNVNTPSLPTSQSCTPPEREHPGCIADTWTCDSWGSCSLSGIQNRSCIKTFDCPSVQTTIPITDQSCQPLNQSQPIQNGQQEDISFINSVLEKLNPKKSETLSSLTKIEKDVKEQIVAEKSKATKDSVVKSASTSQKIATDQKVASSISENKEPIKPSVVMRIIRWFLSLF